jgi:hypothetical protein
VWPGRSVKNRAPYEFFSERRAKRELRRRSAVKLMIGHVKGGHRMGRNHLVGPAGDAINAVLAADGSNFKRLPTGALTSSAPSTVLTEAV